MQEQSDAQLLRDYAKSGLEPAFREIVTRHTDLVYSAALRQVESPDLARDLAQGVFTDLARKARPLAEKLAEDSSLVGWLYRSTRFAALKHLRDDRRRLAHERQAMEQLMTNSETAPDWQHVRPVLDEAMAELNDEDREAVLLRFFKNCDFHAVGQALGVSDAAAQKRVSRAVERLRGFFAKRGVAVGASGLAVVLSANAVQAAPIGLAVTISTAAAMAGTTIAATATASATKAIAMTTLQKTIIGATLTVAVGTGIYEASQASNLRGEVQTLRQQQVPLTEELTQIRAERDETLNKLTATRQENERLRQQPSEVLKLRAEVSRLRAETQKLAQTKVVTSPEAAGNDPFIQSVLSLAARAIELGQLVQQNPDKQIPELQLLTENDWLEAAKKFSADSESDPREQLKELRLMAKRKMYPAWQRALDSYAKDHNDQLPPDVFELKPYFETPVDDAILRRYHMVNTGTLSHFDWLRTGKPPPQKREDYYIIAENVAVDRDYDTVCSIGLGTSSEKPVGIGKQ